MRRADNLTTFMCRLTSWNPQVLSRSVMGLLYLLPWHVLTIDYFVYISDVLKLKLTHKDFPRFFHIGDVRRCEESQPVIRRRTTLKLVCGILMLVFMKSIAVWNVTPCSCVDRYFVRSFCLRPQGGRVHVFYKWRQQVSPKHVYAVWWEIWVST